MPAGSPRFDPSLWRRALQPAAPAVLDGSARAAVAIVVRPRVDEDEILLIRRSQRADDPWSGHMAFPGGRSEPSDADLCATAIRETRAEIGLDLLAHAELLGRLDDLAAIARGRRTGLTISPFVFAARQVPPLVLNHEVDEVVWAPLGPLQRGEAAMIVPYEHEGRTLELPGYRVGEHVVWGLTHRMLASLFEALDLRR